MARSLLVIAVLVSGVARAQEADSPVAPPSPPPPPPTELLTPPAPPKPPLGPPRWGPLTGSLGVQVDVHFASGSIVTALEVQVGRPFGFVSRSTVGDTYEGLLVAPVAEAVYGRLGGGICSAATGSSLCGDRFNLGALAMVGWGRGLADADNVVHPTTMVYAQLGVLADRGFIPSQPLVPGTSWWQAVGRGRVGLRWPIPGRAGPRVGSSPLVLNIAVVGDWAPWFLKGLAGGFSVGVGL